MPSHAVYSVSYVKRLEKWACFSLFSIGVLLPLGVASLLFDTSPLHSFKPNVLEDSTPHQEGADMRERIQALDEARVEAQIRTFIYKNNKSLSYTKVDKIARLEAKYASQYNVPLEIGLAITLTESTFNPNAKSPTGPAGLKQIAFSYWDKECSLSSRKQLMEVDRNIECGYRIISKLHTQTGSWEKALKRYYGGSSEENMKYMLTVMRRADRIRSIVT